MTRKDMRRAFGAKLGWLLRAAVVAGVGCGPSPHVGPERTVFPFEGKAYLDVYEDWTRTEDLFDVASLSNVLRVSATLEARAFRRVYIDTYAADYGLPEAERAALQAEADEETRSFVRILLTLSGRDHLEGNLNGEEAAWKVWLRGPDGAVVAPDEKERIVNPDPELKKYFPSISPFRQVFRIRFPRLESWGGDSRCKLVLTVAGAYGSVDLPWEFPAGQL